MKHPIVDLHCDLLLYLASGEGRTPNDPPPRCSLPFLQEGGVSHQVLAIYAETKPHSVLMAKKQIEIFHSLSSAPVTFLPAFENASGFALENEPLKTALDRLESFLEEITPLYVSFTWNGENRFGGGCGADVGLKPDGRELLSFLSGRGIAIDLSHASDPLARDILSSDFDAPVMASHSNFRFVCDAARNLPDDIAKEIIRRQGAIGLNFVNKFLGSPAEIIEHVEKALELGGKDALAFGADFFEVEAFGIAGFHNELSDSRCYPALLSMLEDHFDKELLRKIASKNALAFIEKCACYAQ